MSMFNEEDFKNYMNNFVNEKGLTDVDIDEITAKLDQIKINKKTEFNDLNCEIAAVMNRYGLDIYIAAESKHVDSEREVNNCSKNAESIKKILLKINDRNFSKFLKKHIQSNCDKYLCEILVEVRKDTRAVQTVNNLKKFLFIWKLTGNLSYAMIHWLILRHAKYCAGGAIGDLSNQLGNENNFSFFDTTGRETIFRIMFALGLDDVTEARIWLRDGFWGDDFDPRSIKEMIYLYALKNNLKYTSKTDSEYTVQRMLQNTKDNILKTIFRSDKNFNPEFFYSVKGQPDYDLKSKLYDKLFVVSEHNMIIIAYHVFNSEFYQSLLVEWKEEKNKFELYLDYLHKQFMWILNLHNTIINEITCELMIDKFISMLNSILDEIRGRSERSKRVQQIEALLMALKSEERSICGIMRSLLTTCTLENRINFYDLTNQYLYRIDIENDNGIGTKRGIEVENILKLKKYSSEDIENFNNFCLCLRSIVLKENYKQFDCINKNSVDILINVYQFWFNNQNDNEDYNTPLDTVDILTDIINDSMSYTPEKFVEYLLKKIDFYDYDVALEVSNSRSKKIKELCDNIIQTQKLKGKAALNNISETLEGVTKNTNATDDEKNVISDARFIGGRLMQLYSYPENCERSDFLRLIFLECALQNFSNSSRIPPSKARQKSFMTKLNDIMPKIRYAGYNSENPLDVFLYMCLGTEKPVETYQQVLNNPDL